jgi:hypothetical protein
MRAAFGVRLEGIPPLPFRLARPNRADPASLRWDEVSGAVGGDDFWMHDEGDRISVGWSAFASYEIDVAPRGGSINVTTAVPSTEAAVAFVFSVLPLVLPAWSLEPFHGSAVLTEAGALAVLGPSGAGKSSLAAALERRGLPLLADDTCAFDRDLMLWPGAAAINPRWADALQRPVGENNEKLIRVPEIHADEPAHPVAIVVLDVEGGSKLAVSEPSVAGRLQGILTNARHGSFLLERRRALRFKVATDLARLPLALVKLDPARHGPDDVLEALAPWSERCGVRVAVSGDTR